MADSSRDDALSAGHASLEVGRGRWDALLVVVASLLSFGFVDGIRQRAQPVTFLIGNTLPIALLIALPMTLLVVSGEIDLSVASTAGLSSAVIGALVDHAGLDHRGDHPDRACCSAWCAVWSTACWSPGSGCPPRPSPSARMAAYRGLAQGRRSAPTSVTDFPAVPGLRGRTPRRHLPAVRLPAVPRRCRAHPPLLALLHATPFGRSAVRHRRQRGGRALRRRPGQAAGS